MNENTKRLLLTTCSVALALGAAAAWRAAARRPSSSSAGVTASAVASSPQGPAAPAAGPAAPPRTASSASAKHAEPAGPSGARDGASLADEPALMARLRAAKDTDPSLVVDLAREGNRRFPGTADAPERAAALIHALASLGRASEARREAEDMVNDYPDSTWVREIEAFTGAHRHRNVRVSADGAVEFY
ncbi:MAG TPA: hypothetical protein VE987_06890 [Polyangiaceae bacterium]|nr:hypothetical protein [Polyangiaceae bacterium]